MVKLAVACALVALTAAQPTYFQSQSSSAVDAPTCRMESGRTVVHYDRALHNSFKCTHNAAKTACSCAFEHPTHGKGGCMQFDHDGVTHNIHGDCTDSGRNPIHGNWGSFGGFTTCDKSCGGGSQIRTRSCDNPAPKWGGNTCAGSATESRTCNTNKCSTSPTGLDGVDSPEGATWTKIADINNPNLGGWQGSSNSRSGFSSGSDYWIGINAWRTLLSNNAGSNKDLLVKIFLSTGKHYTLEYKDWDIKSNIYYSHKGGKCYNGSCSSGPQMQHNDGRQGTTGSWYDRACCCSSNNGFGWYGHCGFGQFGFIADGSHGGKFSHPINRDGNYVNPPVGSDSRGEGNVLKKEFWLTFYH